MKCCLYCIVFAVCCSSLEAQSGVVPGVVFDDVYLTAYNAERVGLTETDPEELRRAACYYFFIAEYAGELGSDPESYLRRSYDLIYAAYRTRRDDVRFLYLYGIISMALAGSIQDDLAEKIRYTNRGIYALDRAAELLPGSLEILAARVCFRIEVPVYFRNLREEIRHDAELFLDLCNSVRPQESGDPYDPFRLPQPQYRIDIYRQGVLIILAQLTEERGGSPAEIIQLTDRVDEELLYARDFIANPVYMRQTYEALKERYGRQ